MGRTISDLDLSPKRGSYNAGNPSTPTTTHYPVIAVLYGVPAHIVGYARTLFEAKELAKDLHLEWSQAYVCYQRSTNDRFYALRP